MRIRGVITKPSYQSLLVVLDKFDEIGEQLRSCPHTRMAIVRDDPVEDARGRAIEGGERTICRDCGRTLEVGDADR